MAKPQYFLSKNCPEGPIAGVQFQRVMKFTPTNSWWGVCEVADPDVIARLKQQRGVKEIDAEDYGRYMMRIGGLHAPKLVFQAEDPVQKAMPVAAPQPVLPVPDPAKTVPVPAKTGISLENALTPRRGRSRK